MPETLERSSLSLQAVAPISHDMWAEGTVCKVDENEEKRLAFGWASVIEVNGEEVVDRQGDVISEAAMEQAAYDFVLDRRVGGVMHVRENRRAKVIGRLVESIAFTKEKQEILGIDLGKVGWWIGFRVEDDTTWQAVKEGTLPAFSIHGRAQARERK